MVRSDSERTECLYKGCSHKADLQVLRMGFGIAAVQVARIDPVAGRIVEHEAVLEAVPVAALSVAQLRTAVPRSAQVRFVEAHLVVVHSAEVCSVEQCFDTDRIRWTGLSVWYQRFVARQRVRPVAAVRSVVRFALPFRSFYIR